MTFTPKSSNAVRDPRADHLITPQNSALSGAHNVSDAERERTRYVPDHGTVAAAASDDTPRNCGPWWALQRKLRTSTTGTPLSRSPDVGSSVGSDAYMSRGLR
jgi:hypothetical protein